MKKYLVQILVDENQIFKGYINALSVKQVEMICISRIPLAVNINRVSVIIGGIK